MGFINVYIIALVGSMEKLIKYVFETIIQRGKCEFPAKSS